MQLNPEALADLYAVLQSLEWERYEDAAGSALRLCPVCGSDDATGHTADCALHATLVKATTTAR